MLLCALVVSAQPFHPEIPRTWDDREVAAFQVPLAQRDRSPRYLSSQEYYALKVRPIYRTYPVYAPGREPAGYFESLHSRALNRRAGLGGLMRRQLSYQLCETFRGESGASAKVRTLHCSMLWRNDHLPD